MKKLLSMLAVSTLVGTSASNLKPMFTNNVVNHDFKSNQPNKKISIHREDLIGQKFEFHFKGISKLRDGSMLHPTMNDRMFYLMTYSGLSGNLSEYVHQGFAFNFENQSIWDELGFLCGYDKNSDRSIISNALENVKFLNVTIKGEVKNWPYGYNSFVMQSISAQKSPVDISETIPKNYYLNTKAKTFVYNKEQSISIKEKFIKKAILDGSNITIPVTNIILKTGNHSLVLTLKDEFKQSAILFGGNENTGEITFNFLIKTEINPITELSFQTNTDDTDLTDLSLGFVSTAGNTNGCPIIQTKSKTGSIHAAKLNISLNSDLFDLFHSYYVQGTVNNNNFTESGTKQKVQVNTKITTDGTYHLHLVDTVGNTYDSYLELGKDNWKLKGTFQDKDLKLLANKLNVTVDLTNPDDDKAQATGWLTNYEKFATDLFEKSVNANGKGFDAEIKKDKKNDFTWFLKPLTYDIANETNFNDGIDKEKLNSEIIKMAEKLLKDCLATVKEFTENLNVDTKNIVNKSTLDSYTDWIKGYDTFIKTEKNQWINDIANITSRGFATTEQINQIADHIRGLDFKNYLKNIVWKENKLLKTTSNEYQKYVELDKLQSDTINWVNQTIPEINQAYQQALKTAESGLNLHGYSIDTLLNGKPLPNEREKIEKFADGQSFHNWLQSQANIKFHGWQLTMGFGIGIPLFLILLGITWFVRKATDPRYNPFAWERKKEKQQSKLSKSTNSSKKNKIKDNEK